MACAYAVYRLWPVRLWPAAGPGARWLALGAAAFFSLAPDLDFLLGLLIGPVSAYHNNLSHSAAFGLSVSAAAALVVRMMWPILVPRGFLAWAYFSTAYASHLAVDYLTWGRGVMLGWPFTETRFSSPVHLFTGVRWSEGFWFAPHLWTLLNDTLFAALLVAVVNLVYRARRSAEISGDSL